MKYLRKIAIVAIAVIFLAAAAIGTGVMFAVRNVNITYLNYGGEQTEQTVSVFKQAVLDKYRGTVIAFVGEDGVKECVPDGYYLERFEKAYPCTLNITLKERREVYAVKTADGYDIYDEDGEILRKAESLSNSSDNSPNVILNGTESAEDITELAKAGKLFRKQFSSLRAAVESITLLKPENSFEDYKYIFTLRCGIMVEVQGRDKTEEKLGRASAVFATLSGEQKLGGTVYCYVTAEGNVRATYNNAA